MFQILTLENWNDNLYACLRSDINEIFTLLFLISWIFIGNYVLLNLFLTILLEGFENEDLSSKLQGLDEDIEIA